MLHPPIAQIERGLFAADACAPAKLLLQARNRQRRTVGRAVKIDGRRLAGFGETADETGMQLGQMLSPLQRRPFSPGRNVVEKMFRLRRLEQQRHGVRDIGRVDPILDARARQNSFALLTNGGKDLRLWTERVAYPGRPFPSPEDTAQPHTDDIEVPERSQTRSNSLG